MFRTFHFGELKSLELLYEQLKKCYELYQVHDSSLADYLKLLLKESQRHVNQRGIKSDEGKILSLEAELTTSERGIHPYTLHLVSTGKRKMEEMVQYKILQELEEIFRIKLQNHQLQLQTSYTLCQQIITLALNSNFVSETEIMTAINQHNTEGLWKKIFQHNELLPSCRVLVNQVSEPDILLLIQEVAENLIQLNQK